MSGSEPTKPTRPAAPDVPGGSAPLPPKSAPVARAVGTLAALAAIAVACASSPRGGTVEAPGGGAPGAPAASAQASASPAGPGPVTTSVVASGDAGGASGFAASGLRSQVVPPDLGVVERMCALLTSCDKLPIPRSLVPDDFASCVKKMSDEMSAATAINFSLTLRECGLQSDSCAGLRSCALRGASPEACSGRGKQGFVGFCDDAGRALTCWHDQTLAVRDCPRGGEQCIVVGGEATCTLGPCGSVAEGDKPRCSGSGTHLLHCEKGKLASLNCGAFGLKCSVAPDGAAGCATSGPACAAGAVRCDGQVSVGCYNGHEVRVDCAAAGLACNQGPGGGTPVGACVAPAPAAGACDPNDKARCDDGSIKYCAAGRPRSYSCKDVGFGRCDASRDGIRCVP
jgi:hypothetical protein